VNRSIVVVTAGLSQPSSTRLLADRLAASATSRLRSAGEDVSVSVVEVRELAHDLTDHLLTGIPSRRLGDVLGRVGTADGLVVVTPVFRPSYGSALARPRLRSATAVHLPARQRRTHGGLRSQRGLRFRWRGYVVVGTHRPCGG